MAENVTIPNFNYVRDMFFNYLAIKKAVQEYRQDAGTAKEMSQQSLSKTDKIPMKQVEPTASWIWRPMRPMIFPQNRSGTTSIS